MPKPVSKHVLAFAALTAVAGQFAWAEPPANSAKPFLLPHGSITYATRSDSTPAAEGDRGKPGSSPQPPPAARAKPDVLYGCAGAGPECCYIFEIRDYSTASPSLKVIGEQRVGFGIHDLAVS